MKCLGIALLLAAIVASYVSSEPNQATSAEKQSAKRQSPPPSPTVTNNNYESRADSDHANDYPPHWYTALKRPEWWLVIAAVLTLACSDCEASVVGRERTGLWGSAGAGRVRAA